MTKILAGPKVYLAGPIDGCSYEEAVAWRVNARDSLAEHGILGYSPMRAKEYLKDRAVITGWYDHVMSTAQAIMKRDYYDCTHADVLLINFLGARKVSAGTLMELAWAYSLHTPVVACMEEKGNPHDGHAMINQAITYRVTTLEEGLNIVRAILIP
jgi:nucleoside 2-deoxyribosyltransferase